MRAHSLAVLTALAASTALLAACGSEKTVTTVDGSTVTVDDNADNGSVTITTQEGENAASMVSGSGAKWPGSAPAYAPPYPGSTMVSAMTGTADGKAGGMATFETADAPEKVVAFYREKASSAGLEKVTTMAGEGMTMFAATDPSGETGVSVQASTSDGKTMGSVSFTSAGADQGNGPG